MKNKNTAIRLNLTRALIEEEGKEGGNTEVGELWIAGGKEIRKAPLSSIFTLKPMEALSMIIPHTAIIYGRWIYLVTEKERYKGEKRKDK